MKHNVPEAISFERVEAARQALAFGVYIVMTSTCDSLGENGSQHS
jgi:hypothetical protein